MKLFLELEFTKISATLLENLHICANGALSHSFINYFVDNFYEM